jgi:hypothetical protein
MKTNVAVSAKPNSAASAGTVGRRSLRDAVSRIATTASSASVSAHGGNSVAIANIVVAPM